MKRLILLLMISTVQAQTVTLTPVKDTDVYSYPGDGNPTSTTFSLGVSSTPTDSTTLHSQKSLIQFDLAALPFPASEIGSAELRLFVLPPDPTYGSLSPGDVHVHRQAVAWTVSASSPKWSVFQSASAAGAFPVAAASANQWVSHDITATATGWASGTFPNHGLFLAPASDRFSPVLNVTFASMEVPNYRPQLVITRKPPALAISSGGGVVTLRWPVGGSDGWVLQRADSPGGPWLANTSGITSADGFWQLQELAGAREFFRLARD